MQAHTHRGLVGDELVAHELLEDLDHHALAHPGDGRDERNGHDIVVAAAKLQLRINTQVHPRSAEERCVGGIES